MTIPLTADTPKEAVRVGAMQTTRSPRPPRWALPITKRDVEDAARAGYITEAGARELIARGDLW